MNKNIKVVLVISLLALFAGASFLFMNKKEGPTFVSFDGDATISMGEDTYTPQNIRIKKGAKVKFVNESGKLRWPASDLHPSHLIYSAFDSKEPVEATASWEFQFDQTGEWGYHDHLAPYITGMIEVSE